MRRRKGVPDCKVTVRQLPVPGRLQKIEMVGLAFSSETGGVGERWAHSPSNQSFQARGYGPIRQVDPRAAEETLQLVLRRQLHSSRHIPKKEAAVQIGTWGRLSNRLRCPLACRRRHEIATIP